jgi:hypothetical protein
MVWPTEVTGLTSIGFEADRSYHFPGNFRRPGKADESYLTSVSPDGCFCHYCSVNHGWSQPSFQSDAAKILMAKSKKLRQVFKVASKPI